MKLSDGLIVLLLNRVREILYKNRLVCWGKEAWNISLEQGLFYSAIGDGSIYLTWELNISLAFFVIISFLYKSFLSSVNCLSACFTLKETCPLPTGGTELNWNPGVNKSRRSGAAKLRISLELAKVEPTWRYQVLD